MSRLSGINGEVTMRNSLLSLVLIGSICVVPALAKSVRKPVVHKVVVRARVVKRNRPVRKPVAFTRNSHTTARYSSASAAPVAHSYSPTTTPRLMVKQPTQTTTSPTKVAAATNMDMWGNPVSTGTGTSASNQPASIQPGSSAGIQGGSSAGVMTGSSAGLKGVSSGGLQSGSSAGLAGVSSGGVKTGSSAGVTGVSSGGVTGPSSAGQVGYSAAGVTGPSSTGTMGISSGGASGMNPSNVNLTPTNQVNRSGSTRYYGGGGHGYYQVSGTVRSITSTSMVLSSSDGQTFNVNYSGIHQTFAVGERIRAKLAPSLQGGYTLASATVIH
jgi:hypothetical protein